MKDHWQIRGELLHDHGIDLDAFIDGTLTQGCDAGWQEALERCAVQKIEQVSQDASLSQGECASKQRSIHRWTSKKRVGTPENNWNVYGISISRQGVIQDQLDFFGQRLHPSNRLNDPSVKQIKFDTSGARSNLYLPPLSCTFAVELLSEYGFDPGDVHWSAGRIWTWIVDHPNVPIWIEESALKALSATSGGQLAIGLNGINSACQKGRSDRLRRGLLELAKNSRRITVRFDHGESSRQQAIHIARLLRRAGADAGWWCWLEHWEHKTDDYMAARLRGAVDPLGYQEWGRVIGEAQRPAYTRLQMQWPGTLIDREFQGSDVINGLICSRIIALRGGTGTGKSKALLQAIELLEAQGIKPVILGLYCRASLVHKGACEYGVVDLSASIGSVERSMGLHEGRAHRDGLFCCPESIHKPNSREKTLWQWSFDLEERARPAVLILDEISQSMLHLLISGTEAMRDVRRVAIQAVERLIKNPCVVVIAAEASLGDLELQWLEGLSGIKSYLIHSTFTRQKYVYVDYVNKANLSKLKAQMAMSLKEGGTVWCGFGTKATMEEFDTYFSDEVDKLSVHGGNSSSQDIVDLMSDTENVGGKKKLVLFSPAISSGISLEKTTVQLSGFVQEYAVPPEDALQALNRCRSAEKRVLLLQKRCPQAMLATLQSCPSAVHEAYSQAAHAGQLPDYLEALKACDRVTLEYAFALEARHNLEAADNDHVLRSRLLEDGYEMQPVELLFGASFTPATTQRKRTSRAKRPVTLRQALLQKLCLGRITEVQASKEVKEAAKGGLVIDLCRDEPSEAFQWLKRLKVTGLSQVECFDRDSAAFQAVINEFKTLNRQDVKELRRIFDRIAIPGPDDTIQVGPVKTLLWHAGFSAEEHGRRANNGPRAYKVMPMNVT